MSGSLRLKHVQSTSPGAHQCCTARMILGNRYEPITSHLPDEVLSCIVQHVEHRHVLQTIATTCSRLQSLAEPLLYKSILIRHGKTARDLWESLKSSDRRCHYVKSFQVAPLPLLPGQDDHGGIMYISKILEVLESLQFVSLEAPFVRSEYDVREGGPYWRLQCSLWTTALAGNGKFGGSVSGALRTLRWCKVIMTSQQDEQPSNIGSLAYMFGHPTLQHLSIAQVLVTEEDIAAIGHIPRTALRNLVLEACQFDNESTLATILAIPRHLESLSIQTDPFGIFWGERTASIISRQSALKRLSLSGGAQGVYDQLSYQFLHISCIGASNKGLLMPALEDLTISRNTDSQMYGYEHDPETPLSAFNLSKLINLTYLGVSCDELLKICSNSETEMSRKLTPSLRFLTIKTDPEGRLLEIVKPVVEELGIYLAMELGARLRLIRLGELKMAVPPYLFGEQPPDEFLAYDSFQGPTSWDLGIRALVPFGLQLSSVQDDDWIHPDTGQWIPGADLTPPNEMVDEAREFFEVFE